MPRFTVFSPIASLVLAALTLFGASLQAADITDETSLIAAITDFNSSLTDLSYNITAGSPIILTASLPAIQNAGNHTLAFIGIGNGQTIDGYNSVAHFQAFTLTSGVLTIQNLTVKNALSAGANGNDGGSVGGGGGGAGMGAALYVSSGTSANISSVSFTDNLAKGGNGGNGGLDTLLSGDGGDGGDVNTAGLVGKAPTGATTGNGNGGSNRNFGSGGGAGGSMGSSGAIGSGGAVKSPGTGASASSAGTAGGNATTGGGGGGGNGGNGAGGGGGGGGALAGTSDAGAGGVGGLGGNGAVGGNGSYGAGGGGGGGGGSGGGGGGGGGVSAGTPGSGGIISIFGMAGVGGSAGFGGGAGGSGIQGNVGNPGNPGTITTKGAGGAGVKGNGAGAGGGGGGFGGAIFIQTNGTLTIYDDNDFSGNSAQNGSGGVSQNGGGNGDSGAAYGQDIFLQSGAVLNFNLNGYLTLNNPIESDGNCNVTKTGLGTLTLSGINNYNGTTTIDDGTISFALGGSIASDLIINNGGFFTGAGTIYGNVTVNSGATIEPGTSTNSISIGSTSNPKTLTFASGSIIPIQITPAGVSNFAVDGNASLNGTLQLNYNQYLFTVGSQYDVVTTTAGLSGRFASVEQNNSNSRFYFTDVYSHTSPYSATLVFSYSGLVTTNLTDNRLATANYLSANANLLGFDIFTLDALPTPQLEDALDTISPSRDAFATFASQNMAFSFSSLVNSRELDERIFRIINQREKRSAFFSFAEIADEDLIASKNSCPGSKSRKKKREDSSNNPSTWIAGFGNFTKEKAQNQNPSFYFINGGALIGRDYLYENAVVGAALAYGNSSIHEDHDFGKAKLNIGSLCIYGTAFFPDHFFEFSIWNGIQHTHNERRISFANFDQIAASAYNSYQGDAHFGAGYDYSFLSAVIEPFVSVDCAINYDSSYHENGAAPFNMNRPVHFSCQLRSEAGLNGYYMHEFEWGHLIIRAKASYINLAPFFLNQISASLSGAPNSLNVTAITGSQNLISPGIEFFTKTKSGFFASLLYNGEFGSGCKSHEAMLRINSETTVYLGRLF